MEVNASARTRLHGLVLLLCSIILFAVLPSEKLTGKITVLSNRAIDLGTCKEISVQIYF